MVMIKMAKNYSRIDPLSFGVGVIAGCFILTLTYAVMPKTNLFISFPIPNSPRSELASTALEIPTNSSVGNTTGEPGKDPSPASHELESASTVEKDMVLANDTKVEKIDSSKFSDPVEQKLFPVDQIQQSEVIKPLCDPSNRRCDLCDISGDVRMVGKNSSSVILVSPSRPRDEAWIVQPYARKWDKTPMKSVREVKVTSSPAAEAPPCEVDHGAVPAVVFSIAGFTGNYFHDFTDVLVPLFQTARPFAGVVQLVVANYKNWWIAKYRPYFKLLSNHDAIDYDNDAKVHCFKRAIVGLRSDEDLTIEPANSPENYSMVDFMKFMRQAYSLDRDNAISLGPETKDQEQNKENKKKPRLLIIARGNTRKFMNIEQIVAVARDTGFEVVVAEADFDVAKFARVVNSCDVMMGVHGAGLTNFVFLPANAVLIQIVPFGKLDWIARTYFGNPAKRMKLHYLEYTISEEESTLTELYSRDDKVFRDPMAIHKRGWFRMGAIYLDKQNVRLDVKRFRPVLEKALQLLHQNPVER